MISTATAPGLLRPGEMIGPWRIIKVLGRGGYGIVFKVQRGSRYDALKMSLRPLHEQPAPDEEDSSRRMEHEIATLLSSAPHPNLLRVHAVDCWPDQESGYLYFVTDYVEGETFLEWCWRKRPTAAELVDVFTEVVRMVGELHRRGVYHRDLKPTNILVRKEDGRPMLIDFGVARLPGATTLTLGLAPGVLYMQPPEALSFTRSKAWEKGARFEGGVAADLYALGVILYEALCDNHPFSPRLPDEQLLLAIETVVPTPPHQLNPLAPRALSDIAMRLLEKRPKRRYPSAEALLQALWEAAKERKSPAWREPLTPPEEELPAEAPLEQLTQWLARQSQASDEVRHEPSPEEEQQAASEQGMESPRVEEPRAEEAPPGASRERRGRWPLALLASLVLLALLLFALWPPRGTFAPLPAAAPSSSAPSGKGSPTVPTPASPQDSSSSSRATPRSTFIGTWLCAALGLGCPGAQLKPPAPEFCPAEAQQFMFEELKLSEGGTYKAIIDIHQPGDQSEEGTYRDGPVVGRAVHIEGWTDPSLPSGTLLYGRLWTGPGLRDRSGRDVVVGHYTEALLPDGRKKPVCIVLGGPDQGGVGKLPGSQPGAVLLPRELPVGVVSRWP